MSNGNLQVLIFCLLAKRALRQTQVVLQHAELENCHLDHHLHLLILRHRVCVLVPGHSFRLIYIGVLRGSRSPVRRLGRRMRLNRLKFFSVILLLIGTVGQPSSLIVLLHVCLIGLRELLPCLAEIRAQRVEETFLYGGTGLVCALPGCFEQRIQGLCSLLELLVTLAACITERG